MRKSLSRSVSFDRTEHKDYGMDLFEKINRSFGSWYEGLFGGSDDVRPKDILRKILAALEDNRKEGFDNRVYVPNQYILEIAVTDEEEKEYLLSFLDRDELESAIRRYCQQNHYHIRGSLDFTIKEAEAGAGDRARPDEKVRVRCRYNSKITTPEPPVPISGSPSNTNQDEVPFEERTVAGLSAFAGNEDDGGTVPAVASAALMIYAPNRAPYRYAVSRGAVTIGRSPRSGNDIVVETDGQISKKHARIEMDRDGQFIIYDLDSTNGTRVNGRRVDNRLLHDGDEIVLGVSRLMFQLVGAQSSEGINSISTPAKTGGAFGGAVAQFQNISDMGSSLPPNRILRPRNARLILIDGGADIDSFLLASETLIGRGVTNDIVLPDRSIATRHARIVHDGSGYNLEPLDRSASTAVNGKPISPGDEVPLKEGDSLEFGDLHLRFEGGL